MNDELGDLRWALLATDEALDRRGIERSSIGPGREDAATLLELGDDHLFELPVGAARAWTDLMVRLVQAMVRHFPDNVCWDLAALAGHFADVARRPEAEIKLSQAAYVLENLHQMFGAESTIRFRYAHDLLIGFDWARWVAKLPDKRAGIGPYDQRFFHRMMIRGEQIRRSIAAGDNPEFPQIPAGEWRNPFPFQREPQDELRLLRALARKDQLPIRVWERNPEPHWDQDFGRLREIEAEALGLSRVTG